MISTDTDTTVGDIEWIVSGPIDAAAKPGGIVVVDENCPGMNRWASDHADCGPERWPYGGLGTVPAVGEPITDPAIKVHRALDDTDRAGLARLLDHALDARTPLVLIVPPGVRLPRWFTNAWQVVLLAPTPGEIAADLRYLTAVLALAVRQQGRLAEHVARWRAVTAGPEGFETLPEIDNFSACTEEDGRDD